MKADRLKSRLPVLLAVIIVLMICIGAVRHCGDSSCSQLVEQYRRPGGDTLAVAIEMSPLTYTFENDTAEGFDYSILRGIADAHGMKVAFYPVGNLDDAFLGLRDGKYDLLVATIPATARLKEYFPLTCPVYLDRQVLVQRRDTSGLGPVRSQLDLRGDTVWLAPGSPVRSRLRNMAHEVGDTIYLETLPEYNSEHLAIMTANGEIRHAVVNEAVASRVAADYPVLDISTPVSFNQFQVWAVAPGDSTLLDSLDTWLEQFKQTDAYSRLSERYL